MNSNTMTHKRAYQRIVRFCRRCGMGDEEIVPVHAAIAHMANGSRTKYFGAVSPCDLSGLRAVYYRNNEG